MFPEYLARFPSFLSARWPWIAAALTVLAVAAYFVPLVRARVVGLLATLVAVVLVTSVLHDHRSAAGDQSPLLSAGGVPSAALPRLSMPLALGPRTATAEPPPSGRGTKAMSDWKAFRAAHPSPFVASPQSGNGQPLDGSR